MKDNCSFLCLDLSGVATSETFFQREREYFREIFFPIIAITIYLQQIKFWTRGVVLCWSLGLVPVCCGQNPRLFLVGLMHVRSQSGCDGGSLRHNPGKDGQLPQILILYRLWTSKTFSRAMFGSFVQKQPKKYFGRQLLCEK